MPKEQTYCIPAVSALFTHCKSGRAFIKAFHSLCMAVSVSARSDALVVGELIRGLTLEKGVGKEEYRTFHTGVAVELQKLFDTVYLAIQDSFLEGKGEAKEEIISLDAAIKVLNSLVAADPEAMKTLARTRVLCNQKIVDHPTAQVVKENGLYKIGLLGVLNAIFSAAGSSELLAAEYNDDDASEDKGKLLGFGRMI